MFAEILFEIGKQLTKSKIPVRDQFTKFDHTGMGIIARDQLEENVLENYLGLREVLTPNQLKLFALHYDPSSSFRVDYN